MRKPSIVLRGFLGAKLGAVARHQAVPIALLLLGAALAPLPAIAQVYRVSMTNPGPLGLMTNCGAEGYVLARQGGTGTTLQADGTDTDANGQLGPDLFVNLMTPVEWTRKYNAGRGLAGVFNGCFGKTSADPVTGNQGYSGNLFIFFETFKGKPTVRFIWHFDYYLRSDPTVREHFTMDSEKIPFVALTGGNISGRVAGNFNLKYFLREGRRTLSSYEPFPGGTNLPFQFDLAIAREK